MSVHTTYEGPGDMSDIRLEDLRVVSRWLNDGFLSIVRVPTLDELRQIVEEAT